MSEYDFELETAEERKARKAKEASEKAKKQHRDRCIQGFHLAKTTTTKKKYFPPPRLPPDFTPKHKQRKSRFEQSVEKVDDSAAKRGLGRHALSVQERQVLLGEEPVVARSPPKPEDSAPTPSVSQPNPIEQDAKKLPPEQDPSIQERVERIKKFVQVLQAHSSTPAPVEQTATGPAFKPFAKNPEKQERYEKYLTLVASGFQGSALRITLTRLFES